MKKNIALYTSTRAEYGLLRPLMTELLNYDLVPEFFVTGTHLSSDFSMTVKEIEKDFPNNIGYRVLHQLKEKSPEFRSTLIMADALEKYALALVEKRPDMAVVLGDRYEAFCFGIVCASLGIPLVHLHGGELTFGATDEKYRHCLTKLSDWHFVACEKYRQRVIQLGEHPDNVFNVGALGVDNALNLKLKTKAELANELGLPNDRPWLAMTFHPETNSSDYGVNLLNHFLKILEPQLRAENLFLVVTGVNNDTGANEIRKVLSDFEKRMGTNLKFIESLGVVNYLSVVKIAEAVIGNSSSGILEAHSLGTPTVNVGSRQDGREREASVMDFPTANSLNALDLKQVITKKTALKSGEIKSIFGNGRTSQKMAAQLAELLQSLNSQARSQYKIFNDLKVF